MAKVKGSVVRSNVAFLKEKLGEEGFERVLQKLDEGERAILGSVILQSGWYEYSLLLDLMEAASKSCTPPPGLTLAYEMGRFSAEYGLNTVYKVFFRVADPHFIIRKASQIFSNYFDSGVMEIVSLEPKAAHIRIRGFDQPCRAFCDRAMGWMVRTLELSGCKAVATSHPKCMARGDDSCDFVGRWA